MVNAAGLEHRALADDRLGHLGIQQFAGGEITGAGVNRKLLIVEGEGGIGLIGECHVGLVEGTDRADVLPVVVEQIALQVVVAPQRLRDDLLAEIRGTGVLGQEIKECVAAEHVDAHRGQVGALQRLLRREPHSGGVHPHRLELLTLWLFAELLDAAVLIGVHQAETFGLGCVHGQGTDAHIRACLDVVIHKKAVIHPVELVAGEDQVVVHIPFLEQPLVLAHSIGGAFEPAGAFRCLLGGQHLHKTLSESSGEVVALREVAVQ